jgi:putative heme-binding domain-containing protein
MLSRAFLFAVLPLFWLSSLRAGQANANPFAKDAARRDAGQARFRQLCTSCHGVNGEGGQGEGHGPNLVDNSEVRRSKDSRLFQVIHNGISGTAMPAFALPEPQIWELVTFVRGLSAPVINMNLPGDQKKGEALFWEKGACGTCHMLGGRGGYLGPDLSNIGVSARLDELRAAVLNPSLGSSEGFHPARLQTPGAPPLKAIIKHATNWSAEVLDENGHLHLLSGAEMKQMTALRESWMPSYANKFTPEELQDLLAFLSRQSVRASDNPKAGSGTEMEK